MTDINIVTSPPWAVIAAGAIALATIVYVGLVGWDDVLEWWRRRHERREMHDLIASRERDDGPVVVALVPMRTAKFRRRYRRSVAWHRVKHALGIRCRGCV